MSIRDYFTAILVAIAAGREEEINRKAEGL